MHSELKRLPDWDRRLAKVVAEHIRAPAVWGELDCIIRVADVVAAITGVDLAEGVRGKYSTEAEALELLEGLGCANVEQLLEKHFEPVGRLKARRGDLMTIEENGTISAAYVTEYGVAVSTSKGTFFRPQTSPSIRKAFKVGR